MLKSQALHYHLVDLVGIYPYSRLRIEHKLSWIVIQSGLPCYNIFLKIPLNILVMCVSIVMTFLLIDVIMTNRPTRLTLRRLISFRKRNLANKKVVFVLLLHHKLRCFCPRPRLIYMQSKWCWWCKRCCPLIFTIIVNPIIFMTQPCLNCC